MRYIISSSLNRVLSNVQAKYGPYVPCPAVGKLQCPPPPLLRPRKVSFILLSCPFRLPTESGCQPQLLASTLPCLTDCAFRLYFGGCFWLVTWQIAERLQLARRYQMMPTAWTDTCRCCGQSFAARTSVFAATPLRYVSAMHTSARSQINL